MVFGSSGSPNCSPTMPRFSWMRPARSTGQAAGLPKDALIEIELVAAL